ncbi:MAG: sugar-binding domain-containing protein [Planctomycetota bacterium]
MTPKTTNVGERASQSLDGVWDFMPGSLEAERPAAADNTWGKIAVPGSWKSFDWPRVELGLKEAGLGPAWSDYSGGKKDPLPRGWYRRSLTVPADWDGRGVILSFDRLGTDATVYIDGQEVGGVSWPSGELRINDSVKAGQTHELMVRVDVDLTDAAAVQDLVLDAHKESTDVATAAGLIGKVILRSEPKGPHIEDVFVRTAVEAQTLTLDIDLVGLEAKQTVRVVARMLDHDGKVERTFEGTAKADPEASPPLSISFDWADPRLWDLNQPELYVLDLSTSSVSGTWEDRVHQRFGFREFRIEGRGFVLNGVPIRLRPIQTSSTLSIEEAEQVITRAQKAGFNQVQPWPGRTGRGRLAAKTHLLRQADERGMLVTAVVTDMRDYIGVNGKRWYKRNNAELFRRHAEIDIRPLRNYPAVVTLVTTPNFLGHSQDQNPLLVGRHEGGESKKVWEERLPAAKEGVVILKSVDPTRPVMLHNGSYVGDIYSVNFYLNWTPLEERRRWFTHFQEHGEMPLLTVETGLPMFTSLMRGRAGYANATKTEPFVTEFLAEYLGSTAYAVESEELRGMLVERFRHTDRYASMHNWPIIMNYQPWEDIQRLHIRDSQKGWRLVGPTAGALPWNLFSAKPDHEWTPRDYEWAKYNQDTLVFIAGSPKDVFEQGQRFELGQTVSKQAAVVNDGRAPVDYQGQWTATLDGQPLASGTVSGRVDPATHGLAPIAFELPKTVSNPETERLDGEITLKIKVGDDTFEDRFAFRAFAPAKAPAADSAVVAVIDPVGKTTEALQAIGLKTAEWSAGQKPSVLLVGREAMQTLEPETLSQIEAYVRDGGTAVVMPQQAEFYTDRLSLRISEQISRQMYPLPNSHRLTAGLDATDLHRFNGVSSLLPHHRDFEYNWRTEKFPDGALYPPYGWRWGGDHGVSSIPLEIPHRSAATPAMIGGFDLAYSPVLAMPIGDGQLVLNTLDLEDHAGVDPVAARLLRRITDAQTFADTPRRATKTVYLGGDAGAELLDSVGVLYETADGQEPGDYLSNAASTLLILDGSSGTRAELDRFLEAGGRALVLPLEKAAYGARVVRQKYDASAPAVPDWPEARGVTVAMLRPRASIHRHMITEGMADLAADGLIGRRVVGDGVALFVQAEPTVINRQSRPYLRHTVWNQTRLIAQLASNLGARFAFDEDLRLAGADASLLPMELTTGWHAAQTITLPEAPSPNKVHTDPGVSEAAQRAIRQHAAGVLDNRLAWVDAVTPALMESYGPEWEASDGEAVLVTEVELPESWRGQTLTLELGTVDDFDHVYVNGRLIGKGEGWNKPRTYQVSRRMTDNDQPLRIAVRVFDHFGGGGITGGGVIPQLKPRHLPERPGPYHPDYRDEFRMGDHPDRYYRW